MKVLAKKFQMDENDLGLVAMNQAKGRIKGRTNSQ